MVLVGIGTGQYLMPPRLCALMFVGSADDTTADLEVLTNKMYAMIAISRYWPRNADADHRRIASKYGYSTTPRRVRCGNEA